MYFFIFADKLWALGKNAGFECHPTNIKLSFWMYLSYLWVLKMFIYGGMCSITVSWVLIILLYIFHNMSRQILIQWRGYYLFFIKDNILRVIFISGLVCVVFFLAYLKFGAKWKTLLSFNC